MIEEVLGALLSIALAAIAMHLVLAGLLRSRVDASLRAVLFARGHVRGGEVESLRSKYLLPWVAVPEIPSPIRTLFILSLVSAAVAVGALAALAVVRYSYATIVD